MRIVKITLLAVLAAPFLALAGNADKALIVTGTDKPSECISSIHVNNVDGREVKVPPLGFDIEPGSHTIKGRGVIDTTFCKAVGPAKYGSKVQPLEAVFEAGKTYYVGLDHSSSKRKDWRLVIWKVEG